MTKKVLIAEDQPDSRKLLADIVSRFRPYGVEVVLAQNGSEALEQARKEHPTLILLDVMMPGVNGLEVCRQLKADPELKHTYVIVVSAKAQPEDRREAALAGADEYLTKPFDINAVVERVQSALGVTLI
jgi:CheY-like chemotaxis protein